MKVSRGERTPCEYQNESDVKPPLIKFGKKGATILKTRSWKGPLFPYLQTVRSGDPASALFERCKGLAIKGVTLQFTSEVMPGVERSFESFSDAADEASLSRLFAGQHFRFDLTTGERLGCEVADFVVYHFLTPRHREEREDRDGRSDEDK